MRYRQVVYHLIDGTSIKWPIQCGLYRSGKLWAHAAFPTDCHPDIVTMAKPLANGFPVGAILVRDSIAQAMTVGVYFCHPLSFINELIILLYQARTELRLADLLSRLAWAITFYPAFLSQNSSHTSRPLLNSLIHA
jgi:hypothetical protein